MQYTNKMKGLNGNKWNKLAVGNVPAPGASVTILTKDGEKTDGYYNDGFATIAGDEIKEIDIKGWKYRLLEPIQNYFGWIKNDGIMEIPDTPFLVWLDDGIDVAVWVGSWLHSITRGKWIEIDSVRYYRLDIKSPEGGPLK